MNTTMLVTNFGEAAKIALDNLQKTAIANGNLFEALKASKVCSLGQMSEALYEVGG
jgi:methylmalonyl-CoA mutase